MGSLVLLKAAATTGARNRAVVEASTFATSVRGRSTLHSPDGRGRGRSRSRRVNRAPLTLRLLTVSQAASLEERA